MISHGKHATSSAQDRGNNLRISRTYHVGHGRGRHSVAQQTRNLWRLLFDRVNKRVRHDVANLGMTPSDSAK